MGLTPYNYTTWIPYLQRSRRLRLRQHGEARRYGQIVRVEGRGQGPPRGVAIMCFHMLGMQSPRPKGGWGDPPPPPLDRALFGRFSLIFSRFSVIFECFLVPNNERKGSLSSNNERKGPGTLGDPPPSVHYLRGGR